ncbi:uncharacterized protein G2W53_022026 [Senna tora]|uniref:Uncharacterized protein n=1 Tax=Senna tora TaxID=362788 RepID=A0A834WIE1_9FABA|nr:uncharacterized protein G2W53_022026 [Senna tora]
MPHQSRGLDASFLEKFNFEVLNPEVVMPRSLESPQSGGRDASFFGKFNFEVVMPSQSQGRDASFLGKFNFEVLNPEVVMPHSLGSLILRFPIPRS